MEKWKEMLCSGNSELGQVEIKRGIFQGDSLFPLVFVLALIPFFLKTAVFHNKFALCHMKSTIYI